MEHRNERRRVGGVLGDECGTWNDVVSFGGCWYVSGGVDGDGAYRVVDLEPRGAHRVELALYAATDDCLTTDSYRFRTDVPAWNPGGSPDHPPSERWVFVIDIESERG